MSQNPAFRFLRWENAPRFGITEIIGAALIAEGIGAATAGTIATVAVPALVGAGVGAAGAAVTGGKPLQGALMGGALGAVGGGLSAALAPAGSMAAVGGGASGGLSAVGGAADAAGSAAFTDAAGNLFDTAGNMVAGGGGAAFTDSAGVAYDAAGNAIPGTVGSGGMAATPASTALAGTPSATGSPLADTTSKIAGGGSKNAGGIGGTGINATNLALGALSALGSAAAKPKQGTWSTPGPNSVAQTPYWNMPLNTNVPGRTPVNPMAGQPASSWYTYGQNPEQNFFQNNSLRSYGFAHGGATNREFTTGGVSKQVRGPGTGVSDSIPAQLSAGKYVLTAADVSRIGNPANPNTPGANDRGARILDTDRKALARRVGQPQFEKKGARAALNEASITHRGRAT